MPKLYTSLLTRYTVVIKITQHPLQIRFICKI